VCLSLPAHFRPAAKYCVVTTISDNSYANTDAGAIPAAPPRSRRFVSSIDIFATACFQALSSLRSATRMELSCPWPNTTTSGAELGTKWEQDWQHQPNAATMYVCHGGIVTASQSKPLSITATCVQYHEYGRRAGLIIRRLRRGKSMPSTICADEP